MSHLKKMCLSFTAMTLSLTQFSFSSTFSENLSQLCLQTEKHEITHVIQPQAKTHKEVDLSVKKPTHFEAQTLFIKQLEKQNLCPQQETLFDFDSLEKLSIVAGDQTAPQKSLAAILPTKTIFGKVVAQQSLATPHTDIQDIQNAQNTVRYFAENPTIALEASTIFNTIGDGQAIFLSFFDERLGIETDITQHLFYGKILGSLNSSSTGLTIKRITGNIMNAALYFVPLRIYMHAMTKLPQLIADNNKETSLIKKLQNIFTIAKESTKSALTTDSIQHDPRMFKTLPTSKEMVESFKQGGIVALMGNLQSFTNATAGDYIAHYRNDPEFNYSLPKAIARTYWMAAVEDAMYAWRASKGIANITLDNAILYNFQTRLISAADVVNGLYDLYLLLQDNPELTCNHTNYTALIDLFENNTNSEISTLTSLLQSNTFNGEASFFSNSGNILAAYHLLNKHKEAFIPALQAAGLLESQWAAAQLITNSTPEKGSYTFVTFTKSEAPLFQAEDARNPLLRDAQCAKTNNFSLGAQQQDQNLLITGPNGSGKSVFMSTAPLIVALAQTLGIAPVQSMTLSPYDHIITSINVLESIQNDLSTFMAQQKRFNMVLRSASQNNNDGKKALVIMDEALSGTSDSIGGPLVYNGGKELAQMPYITTILASHFTQPIELEYATNGLFSTYYLDVAVENNTIQRLFTLVRGKNPWWKIDQEKTDAYVKALAFEA